MDKNVTKKGLLALKDSKPVPITAHSHEIIIPCVYTETVKKIMKAKGIELPLTPAKLAELRKIAKATPGKYEADPEEKAGGSSHAKGTTNVMVNIKNVVGQRQGIVLGQRQGVRRKRGVGRGGRSKIVTTRAAGLAQAPNAPGFPSGPSSRFPPGPPSLPPMLNPPVFPTIRTFAANTPVGFEPKPMITMEQVKHELHKEDALEKRLMSYEQLAKRVDVLDRERIKHLQEQMVHEDDWVVNGRDEAVHEKMKPKSEAVIEDVSEPSEPYEAAAEPAVVPPKIYLWELDKPELIHTVKEVGDEAAQTSFLMEREVSKLKIISKKLGTSIGGLKAAIVGRIVAAINK